MANSHATANAVDATTLPYFSSWFEEYHINSNSNEIRKDATTTIVTPNVEFNTHPIEYRSPALLGDALEYGEHSKGDVVERGDAKIRTLPSVKR